MDNLFDKFVKVISEDLTTEELENGEFKLSPIKKLPGFHKKTLVKEMRIATILDDCITIKADDDLLIYIKEDMRGDLYIEGVKKIDSIFCPVLDEDAIDYLVEICLSKKRDNEADFKF